MLAKIFVFKKFSPVTRTNHCGLVVLNLASHPHQSRPPVLLPLELSKV